MCAWRGLARIQGFRHKELRWFFETVSPARIQAYHYRKLRLQLSGLHSAAVVENLDLPGYLLHQLKGAEKGRWTIWVNANWRIVSLPRFQGQCSESCFYTDPMKTNDHNECPFYATPLQR